MCPGMGRCRTCIAVDDVAAGRPAVLAAADVAVAPAHSARVVHIMLQGQTHPHLVEGVPPGG